MLTAALHRLSRLRCAITGHDWTERWGALQMCARPACWGHNDAARVVDA